MKQYAFLLLSFLLACNTAERQQEQASPSDLKKEVLEVHDEVMPMMGDLRRTRKSILLMVDSLDLDSATKKQYTEVADEIGDASESMMIWMRNYEPEYQGTEEEILHYLDKQKTAILKVNKEMKESLEKGREITGDAPDQ